MPEMLFQAGSISKPVSAAAVLSLVQAGKLDLDRDGNDASERLEAAGQCLDRQGCGDASRTAQSLRGTDLLHGFGDMPAARRCPSLVEVLNGAPPAKTALPCVVISSPTQFRYSGGGYTIIQQLLIDVTDRPFAAFLDGTGRPRSAGAYAQQFSPTADRAGAARRGHALSAERAAGGGRRAHLSRTGRGGLVDDAIRSGAVCDGLAGRAGRPPVEPGRGPPMRETPTPRFDRFGLGLIVGGSPGQALLHPRWRRCRLRSLDGLPYESGDGAVVMTKCSGRGQAGW